MRWREGGVGVGVRWRGWGSFSCVFYLSFVVRGVGRRMRRGRGFIDFGD